MVHLYPSLNCETGILTCTFPSKYITSSSPVSKLNCTFILVWKNVGLVSDVIYVEQIGEDVVEKKKKLFGLMNQRLL